LGSFSAELPYFYFITLVFEFYWINIGSQLVNLIVNLL